MKIFKYKFTALTKVFIWLGLALAATAFGLTIYNIATGSYNNSSNIVFPIISYVAMFIASVLMSVLLISLLVSSYYEVGDKKLKTSFGIIKSSFDTNNITSIVLDRKTDKLAVYFKDGSFIAVVVKREWYEEFVNELLKCNPAIEYSINSQTSPPDEKPKT